MRMDTAAHVRRLWQHCKQAVYCNGKSDSPVFRKNDIFDNPPFLPTKKATLTILKR